MKRLTKLGVLALVLTLMVALAAGCGGSTAPQTSDKLVIGVTPVPHGEVIKIAQTLLEEQGIELEIREFTDYPIVNPALADNQLDANYFQHIPYLEAYNSQNAKQIAVLAKVHIEPMAIYSKKIASLNDLPNNALVAVPNDPTNEGRALLLLESAGLITLKKDVGLRATVTDIAENPKNLRFRELDAAQLTNALTDVDVAVINGNFALDAGFNPMKDSLLIESSDSPYVNVLAVRADDMDNENLLKLAEALNSPEVKQFIEERYEGAVVPVF